MNKTPFNIAVLNIDLDQLDLPQSPEMDEIMAILATRKSPKTIAAWFASTNSWLGGATPLDVVRESPLDVLQAARMEISPIEHG